MCVFSAELQYWVYHIFYFYMLNIYDFLENNLIS